MESQVLAADSSSSSGVLVGLLIGVVVWLLVSALLYWKVFSKAGQPGWASIVPLYNIYVLCKVAGRPGWWLILFIVPIVNIVISIIVALDVAKAFGKGGAFGFFLLWLLPIIGYPIIGFGGATYQGARRVDQSVPA